MAAPRRKRSVMSHPVVITFLILAVIAAMSLAAEVLKPLALSILLAFALTPLSGVFERRGLPRAAATLLTVVLALGVIGGIGYVVIGQLETLADRLPSDQQRIEKKLSVFQPRPDKKTSLDKVKDVVNDVDRKLKTPPLEDPGQGKPAANPVEAASADKEPLKVRVIEQPSFRERLQTAVGPYLEFLGVGSFVLILVLFMMVSREDLRDRIVSLFGHSRVSLTTRTMDEMGQRISRYLATFATVNSSFGLVIGLGLWFIGLKFVVLWGCLAALMRFIPYVGPAIAFALPMLYSVAEFEGWREPLMVLALFAVVEVALNSFLEPVIYGKTTGVSALGLLVAAMFWTWLWGMLGILLSTPLTVCLAVLGKYVPSLGVFATLLGEEAELEPDVRFYQRLVALDRDGAVEVVDAALKSKPRGEVFDEVLIPALTHAERDAADGDLEEQDQAFVWRVVTEIVDELEGEPEITLASVTSEPAVDSVTVGSTDATNAPSADHRESPPRPVIMGVAATDAADAVVLRMLSQLLDPSGLSLEVVTDAATPMRVADRLAERLPAMVVLSHLPPEGLTLARYQVRRLRARFPDLPIVVGRWGATGHTASASEGLTSAGASYVALSLADARDHIVGKLASPTPTPSDGVAPLPEVPGGALAPPAAGDLVNVGR